MARTKSTLTKEQIAALPAYEMQYRHRDIDSKGKVFYTWVDREGNDRFLDYKIKTAYPGMWFSFPMEGTSIVVTSAKFTGEREGDRQRIMEWQMKDRLAQQKIEANKNLKAVALNGPLQKAVHQIKLCYAQLPPSQRNHLIAWLVEELHRK